MTLQTRLSLTRLDRQKNIFGPYYTGSVSRMTGQCIYSTFLHSKHGLQNLPTKGLQNLSKQGLQNLSKHGLQSLSYQGVQNLSSYSKLVLFHTQLQRTTVLQIQKPMKISAVCFKSTTQEKKTEEIHPKNDEMNLRLSVENDYLSWMRNTYMMTLAGLTILNTSSLSDNMVISQVVFLTAFLNLTTGTVGYLHSLSSLRKRNVMRTTSSLSCQIAASFHYLLWLCVLLLILSSQDEAEMAEKGDNPNNDD